MNILLVEDEDVDAIVVERHVKDLRSAPHDLRRADSLREGLAALAEDRPDLIILDMGLPDSRPGETLGAILRAAPGLPVIVLTGDNDEEVAVAALAEGAADYLVKSTLSRDSLHRSIRYALERTRAAAKMREQAELLNRTDEGILVCSLTGEIKYSNMGARALLGESTEDLSAVNLFALLDLNGGKLTQALLAVREQGGWEGESRRAERVIYSRWTLAPTAAEEPEIVAVISDITERASAERRLRSSERFEGVGAVACGIAHDLNNLLTPIMLYVDATREGMLDPGDEEAGLASLEASVARGVSLVRQLKIFGGHSRGRQEPIDFKSLLAETFQQIGKTLSERFETKLSCAGDDILPVIGDAGQLRQAFLNLAVNARDAMPEGGVIQFTLENRLISPEEVGGHWDRKAGRHVCVRVADTGVGIAPRLHERIFEPFYSTKTPQQCTGLGLSTALGIVKSHGGFIEVESEPGAGAVFAVFLPVTPND